jgi:hypothetical protein
MHAVEVVTLPIKQIFHEGIAPLGNQKMCTEKYDAYLLTELSPS